MIIASLKLAAILVGASWLWVSALERDARQRFARGNPPVIGRDVQLPRATARRAR